MFVFAEICYNQWNGQFVTFQIGQHAQYANEDNVSIHITFSWIEESIYESVKFST